MVSVGYVGYVHLCLDGERISDECGKGWCKLYSGGLLHSSTGLLNKKGVMVFKLLVL